MSRLKKNMAWNVVEKLTISIPKFHLLQQSHRLNQEKLLVLQKSYQSIKQKIRRKQILTQAADLSSP